MNAIFLIGMPAAGKTYYAKQLSLFYNVPFLDIDSEVEKEAGISTAQIFEISGESGFREIEQFVLRKIVSECKELTIIACGGGTPVYFDNIDLMKESGCVVYLRASIDLLYDRIICDDIKRPLLENNNIALQLTKLLEERLYIYEMADYIIDVPMTSVSKFEEIIYSCTNRH